MLTGAGVTLMLLTKVLTTPLASHEYLIAYPVVALVGYFLIFRVAGSAIIAKERGLVVRNPLSTRFVAWQDVRRFTLEQWAVFPGIGTIERYGGAPIHVFGVQIPDIRFGKVDRQTEAAIDELNQLLRGRGDYAPTAS
jgi:hypothetical protein